MQSMLSNKGLSIDVVGTLQGLHSAAGVNSSKKIKVKLVVKNDDKVPELQIHIICLYGYRVMQILYKGARKNPSKLLREERREKEYQRHQPHKKIWVL